MSQTLSLSNLPRNPYVEVRLTNTYCKDDGRIMCFGEFINSETGKYTETIINAFSSDQEVILELIKKAEVAHITQPRENKGFGVKGGWTRYRANLRDISEQPIWLQERYRQFLKDGSTSANDELTTQAKQYVKRDLFEIAAPAAQKETQAMPDIDAQAEMDESSNNTFVELPNTSSTECPREMRPMTKNNSRPRNIALPKSAARLRYMDKLVEFCPFAEDDRSRYGKTLGDLVDYCIEHKINPYEQ